MIRTIYRVGSIPTEEGQPLYQVMPGTIEHEGHLILDLIDTDLPAQIIGQWQWDGKGPLIEIVPLDAALLDHLPPTHEYDVDGEIIATHPPVLHLPSEWSGWPAYTSAVTPDIEPARAAARFRVNQAYDRATDMLAADYPYRERESWHVQVAEAKALVFEESEDTPWIDAAALVRGLTREDLATRILANDTLYRQMHGTASGIRQALIDQITAAETVVELEAIEWPTT